MSVASQSPWSPLRGPVVDSELGLPALGSALWRRKWRIIVPTILVALITLGIVQLIPPKYQSESRVLIEERSNIFLRPDVDKEMLDRGTVDQEAVTSQAQLILSRDLAREVIDKLNLGERAEFDPARAGISPVKKVLALLGLIKNPMRMTPEERVLGAYYDRLNVYPVEKSRVIVIDFLSENPDLAARVANAIADAYLARQRVVKQDQARSASEWLAGEIDSMRKKVAVAEGKVESFRAKSNLLVGPNGTTLSAQSLGDLNAQLAAARAQKADAQAKASLIREMLHSGGPIESSDILNSELIRRLSEQRVTLRAQLAEQSSSLLDGHPRIKELKAQIADLDHQIRAEAETIARSFENDAKLAAARVDTLSSSLDQLKAQAASSNEQDVELRALEREAKSERDLLESYLAKYREAKARDTINSAPADARVISRATVSNVPAYPKKLPTVLIAVVAMMMLCCGWVITRELLTAPALVPTMAVAAPLREPVAVGRRRPVVANALGRRVAAIVSAPGQAIGVPVSSIKDVAYSLHHDAGSRIAVFGMTPELDSTAIAIRLARELTHDDAQVVLVGLGAGDEAIKAISTEPSARGLAELALGTASFDDIISRDTLSPLNLITSGQAPADLRAVLSSPAMATSFDALGRGYDHLVVNAGPVGGADMGAIGQIAPHAILVAGTLADGTAAAARNDLFDAGFEDVTILVGAGAGVAQAAA